MTQRLLSPASLSSSSLASYLAMLLVPAALLAGCAAPGGGGNTNSTSNAGGATSTTAPSTAPADIVGNWQLMHWEGPGDVPSLPEGRLINLMFNDRGEVSGTGGCNRIFSQYTVGPAKGQLTIKPLASTRMACPDSMEFEQRYVATLGRVTQFARTDTQLVLTAPGGETLTYAAQTLLNRPIADKPAHTGTQDRVLDVDSQLADCVGVGPRKCLRVRDVNDAAAHPSATDGGAPWELWYAQIDGFDWKPGVEYRVKIHGEPVANPPADASNMRWTLVEVLRQTPSGKAPH